MRVLVVTGAVFSWAIVFAPLGCAQSQTLQIPGIAQIALAGAPAGTVTPSGRDSAPLDAPIATTLPVVAGQAIQISATGLVGYAGSKPNIGPNGNTSTDNTTNLGRSTGMGIGGITGPESGLVGVFTGPTLNLQSIPPSVDYTGDAKDIPVTRPMLQQPFFVGSGVTSTGVVKTWIAPSGAAKLYLGVLDYQVSTNTGSFSATVTLAPAPDDPVNPIRVSGVAQIALAGAPVGTVTPSGRDTAPLNFPANVQVPLIAGQALIFTAWGEVGYAGSTPNLGPNGDTPTDNTTNLGRSTGMGIGGITGPRASLVGVFTGASLNLQSIPPAVDFSSSAARDQATVTPLLQQPFFIGSGLTSTGTARHVTVPTGATNLFLGVLDYEVSTNTGFYIAVVSPDTSDMPSFVSAGVVNGAGFGPNPLAAGSVGTIFGSNLATQTLSATSVPLPTALAGTRAYFELLAAPLYFVSPGQTNLQVPFELNAQQAHLTITRNGAASLPIPLNLSPYAPGIFVGGAGSPVIVDYQTSGLVTASQPAKTGDVLIIYASGLGPIADPPPSGTATPTSQLFPLAVPLTVAFGSQTVTADFAGLAPGLIGVYQVNATVPTTLSPGQTTLQLTVSGASSNVVPLFIGQ